jgi:hypothetical protein
MSVPMMELDAVALRMLRRQTAKARAEGSDN